MSSLPRHDDLIAPTSSAELVRWVHEVAALTQPDHIHWCDGSDAEAATLTRLLLETGALETLHPDYPGCHLYRSHPNDVARVEHLTFVCTHDQTDAGPNNYWMAPAAAHAQMDSLFSGCMRGRTLYVIPYCMGPLDSPLSRCGVEITDSPYVVLNMRIMTRMGQAALARLEREGRFVRGLHSTGDLDPERRFIMHFPEELMIKSFGSGYGGNALLGKKCHALRIASWQARQEGWLAEHMLLVAITNPAGETHYVAAAFPSACGKTNLAMLIPPASMPGWTVRTIGDDIAWLHPGPDGRLWAINPEAGYFGVAPGTNARSNRNAHDMVRGDTIFTNVALTDDRKPWWDGLEGRPAVDWRGRPYDPANGPAAHPNARFTVSARSNPVYADEAHHPDGVPLSAIIFGGRRRSLAPLVCEASDWTHGVLMGASVASETTAAATGAVGVLRRDPMAMKPFCGYHFGDYWQHWIEVGKSLRQPPKVFHVNWFRQDAEGRFLWPGFGENLRVLAWILDRVAGRTDAADTPIGRMPRVTDLPLDGLSLDSSHLSELLAVDTQGWHEEYARLREEFARYGDRVPVEFSQRLDAAVAKLEAQSSQR
jgi:phosphoenolpyruvate carboxykinase (GTP)